MCCRTIDDYQGVEFKVQPGSHHSTSKATVDGRPVFLKRFEADRQEGLKRTVRSLLALNHPGIIKINAVATDGDRALLVEMPLYEETLHEWLGRPQTADAQQNLLLRLCFAVQHAHAHGIVHRDIKPHNVLIDFLGHPILTDFDLSVPTAAFAAAGGGGGAGSAGSVPATTQVAGNRNACGTPGYQAPEALGLVRVGATAGGAERKGMHREKYDAFSLGCVAYQVLLGKQAHPSDFTKQASHAVAC